MTLHGSKDGNARFTIKPFKNVDDMVVFQGFPEVAIHPVIFVEKPQCKIISFLGINIDILFYLIRFMGTVVNRALLSLPGGSLEITRTVLLIQLF